MYQGHESLENVWLEFHSGEPLTIGKEKNEEKVCRV